MNNFDLIVFDWDGTLMDSAGRIVACLRAAIADCKLETRDTDALKNIIGLGLRESVDTLYPGCDEWVHENLTARYRHHYLVRNDTPTPMFEGAAQTVRALAEGGTLLGVATGKGRRGLDLALKESGIGDLFDATRCSDETFSKPHPQMLLEVMEVLGVEPERTLMVGDTEYDMQLAHNAGAAALAVSYGVHERERLLAQEPLGCIDDIAELLPWLAAQGS